MVRMRNFLAPLCGFLVGSHAFAGLVGHWPFDRAEGNCVRDISPSGNSGVIGDAAVRDGALQLDGLGGHVVIGEAKPLVFSNAITACVWIRPSALKNSTVIFGVPHTNQTWTTPMFGMYLSDGRAVFGMWGDRGSSKVLVESAEPLPLDAWSFLAGAYDGATARLYVNGTVSGEKPHRGNIVRNGQPLIVGKGLGYVKPSFRGAIDELRLFDHALDAGAIRALFDAGATGRDIAGRPEKSFGDGTVIVETHGNSPGGSAPWRPRPTRLLELLNGYRPSGDGVALSAYGGWLDRPKENATGFFRVTRIEGRHWLIDPDGHRYFNIGLNAVREPRDLSANFGSPERWAEGATALLRTNGFNGIGNFSSQRLQQTTAPLPWVRRHNFMFEFAKGKKLTEPASGTIGFTNRCMPVFHPDFEAFAEEFAKDLATTANDPTLLGIMTDNELQCPVDLLDRYLSFGPSDPGHAAAKAWLSARKDPGEITLRDRYQFIAFAFERYYQIVTRAIRKHDTNHLYLGSRINYHIGQFDNPWFWKAMAPYHDGVSVNYYGQWGPDARQFADWQTWAGKPILLTEWYAKAMDVPGLANTRGAGWLVRTQEDRARYYQHFALAALEIRGIVGWHFFKYLDDPKESVALDSAGGANKGLCDTAGRPYQPLLRRARAVNREAYPLIEFFDRRNR